MRRSPLILVLLAILLSSPAPALAWLPDGSPVSAAPADPRQLSGLRMGVNYINFYGSALVVLWEDHRAIGSQGIDLYASVFGSQGVDPSWERPVCTALADQTRAAMTVLDIDPCGLQGGCSDIAVAWQDGRGALGDDIFANLVYRSWAEDGVPVCRMPGSQADPAIVGSPDATMSFPRELLVAWRDSRSGTDDIYVQRLAADGHRMWDSTGVAVCDAPFNQGPPRIAAGFETRGALLAWRDERAFPAPAGLYVQSIDSAGAHAAGWPVNGLRIATDHATGDFRLLAGGFVVWTEGIGVERRLRATRVTPAGAFAPGWTDSGVAVTPVVRELSLADVVSDDAGGILVSWLDVVARSVTNTPSIALMVQRLDGLGVPAPGWGTGGVLVTGYPSMLGGGALAPQYDGGAIVTWTGPDGGDGGVLAQRLRADGTFHPSWPASGAVLCAAPGSQAEPVIASDYPGATVAWMDGRSGSGTQVFAQYVTGSGASGLAAVEGVPVLATRLGTPTPNPARGAVRFALDLPASSRVTAEVFDLAGRRLQTLIDGALPAGRHTLSWDGRDLAGAVVPAGMRFVRVRAGGETLERRFVTLR